MIQLSKFIRKLVKKGLEKYLLLNVETFTFFTLTGFYFSIWILNPSNYLILSLFLVLGLVFYFKLKDLKVSLLIVFLASSIIFTGKAYTLQLLPPGTFDIGTYPNGYVLQFVITANLIFAVLMLFILARDLITKKVAPSLFTKLNLIILIFFTLTFISDAFGSKQPGLSLLFDLLLAPSFILYFYFQAYSKKIKKFLPILLSIFAAFIVFESVISFQQFLVKSPIGKNTEIQQAIEYTGNTADELQLNYTYRPGGTFDNPNTLAMNMIFWLTFVFSFYLATGNKKLVYLFCLGLVSLIVTLSRSAWVGFSASLMLIIFIFEKLKKQKILPKLNKFIVPIILLTLPLFIVFILPRAEKSIYLFEEGGGTLRLEQIKATWQIILSHPVFGVGTNMLVLEGFDYLPQSIFGIAPLDVHNWYLSLIANHGIPAFIIFMTFVLLSTKQIFLEVLKRKNKYRSIFINTWFLAGLAAFLVIGAFFANNGLFWVIGGLGYLNNRKV